MATKTSRGDPKDADVKGKWPGTIAICCYDSPFSFSPDPYVNPSGVPLDYVNPVGVRHQTITGGGIAIAPKDVNVIHAMVDQNKKDMRVPVQIASHRQHVYHISEKRPRSEGSSDSSISFFDHDLEGVDLPHNDPLVISLNLAGFPVDKILVDPGSSVNVMYKNLFEMLKLKPKDLNPTSILLSGFNRVPEKPMGVVTLPIYVEPVTEQTEFLVIDVSSPYNAIIGRPWLHAMRAVPSTYYQVLKFHPDTGVEAIRGDQRASKECCMIEVKAKIVAASGIADGCMISDSGPIAVFNFAKLLEEAENVNPVVVPHQTFTVSSHGQHVYNIQEMRPRSEGSSDSSISFFDHDLEGVDLPHNNPLVISLNFGDHLVDKILVDPGSSVNVMYKNLFKVLKLKPEDLKPTSILLFGFNGALLKPMGVVTLPIYVEPVTICVEPVTEQTEFLVIDVSSPYNAIIGRPWLHETKAVPSTYHQLLKFHLNTGVEAIRGDQRASKECCMIEVKAKENAEKIVAASRIADGCMISDSGPIAVFNFAKFLEEAETDAKIGGDDSFVAAVEKVGVSLEHLQIVPASGIPDGWMGLDIGPDSIKTFGEALDSTKTIIWNGPMGMFEFDKFAVGTETIGKKFADLSSGKGVTTIIGGSDSVAAVEKVGLADKMSHISTGGGASLELLEGKSLAGVLALDNA